MSVKWGQQQQSPIIPATIEIKKNKKVKMAQILKLFSTPWSLYSFLPQGLYLSGSYPNFLSIGILFKEGATAVANVPARIGVAKTRGEIIDYPKTPWLLTSMGNDQLD